jgi:hypothetical protein
MTARLFQTLSEPIREAWRRPLSLTECLYAAGVLFLVGSAYCQLYCAISMPAMNGRYMPVEQSMWRSAIETIPALIAFELSKRVLSRGADKWAIAGVAAVILLAAAVSTLLVLSCRDSASTLAMPLRPIIADRLPGITLTAIAIAWASRMARAANSPSPARACIDELPPTQWIDWIRAAGNYVEIRIGARSVLRRMTMAQAQEALSEKAFVRVHRSMLVNRTRIAGLDRNVRPRHVRLTDGSIVKVGQAYRANLM